MPRRVSIVCSVSGQMRLPAGELSCPTVPPCGTVTTRLAVPTDQLVTIQDINFEEIFPRNFFIGYFNITS